MTIRMNTTYNSSHWSYAYSPYMVRSGDDGIEHELPAFEVFDGNGNKVFDTNEDSSAEVQETNAKLGAAAPELLVACRWALTDLEGLAPEDDSHPAHATITELRRVIEATS
jgi:hypothetical protein